MESGSRIDPRREYERRLGEARALEARAARRDRAIADARLAIALVATVLAGLIFGAGRLATAWLVAPALAFVGLVVWHVANARVLRRARRRLTYYERGLDRLDERWAGRGASGDRFRDPEHPFADDLDLFGPGSLFERLSTARSTHGERTLASWLLAPADPDEIAARQRAIAELRDRLDLREDLALLGADVPSGVDFERLAAWGAAPIRLIPGPNRLVAAILAGLSGAALAGWLLTLADLSPWPVGPRPFAMALVLVVGFASWYRRRVRDVLEVIERRAGDLALLTDLLARLEGERFEAPKLRTVAESWSSLGRPASKEIRGLRALADWLEARRNPLIGPFAPLLLWGTQIALAVEAWRARSGPAIAAWLAAIGEFEALEALACFAFENPADPFPDVAIEGPTFAAEGLGHPLLPAARCVRNDVSLGGELRALVVSGSNMSGKSTLLRAVGTNAVLALAGATVRADRLRISPLAIGATLRVQDSLQAGRSRFYAEILRLRAIIALTTEPRPVLFLLDEILHGTNSHDRRAGAEAILRGLIDRGAIGLVTTHDLALAEIADGLGPRAANVHFADRLEGGQLAFDYVMQPGVVRQSNALALMRAVGLDV